MPTAKTDPGGLSRTVFRMYSVEPAVVRGLDDVPGAFRVDDHADARVLLADVFDLLHREARVDGAVALPQNHLRGFGFSTVRGRPTARSDPTPPSRRAARPSCRRCCVRDADRAGTGCARRAPTPTRSVALRVARRADRAAAFADERFDGGGGVDVGDGHHVGDAHLLEFLPAHLELIGSGHVGHRAAGGEVGQNHLLMRRGQDVRALGHEVHAAEDHEVGFAVAGAVLRQLPRVAGVVRELDHLVALIVMPENQQSRAELRPCRGDAAVHLLNRQPEILLRQWLPLVDVFPLVVRQNVQLHSAVRQCDRTTNDTAAQAKRPGFDLSYALGCGTIRSAGEIGV